MSTFLSFLESNSGVVGALSSPEHYVISPSMVSWCDEWQEHVQLTISKCYCLYTSECGSVKDNVWIHMNCSVTLDQIGKNSFHVFIKVGWEAPQGLWI